MFSVYPKEVRQLSSQIPRIDRDAVLRMYKKLPKQSKMDFAKALHNADPRAASQILGKDLTKYNIKLDKPQIKAAKVVRQPRQIGHQATAMPPAADNIVNRVNRILAVPTSIDPELVAAAARRYEQAVPARPLVTTKTRPLTDCRG
ncbi:MAG: hypothetical protein H6Q74_1748 [Firmicutes bacterium]|nr:hypothetical protein [Bacillota bacterium]